MKYAVHNHSTVPSGSTAVAIALDVLNVARCLEENGKCTIYFKDGSARQIDTDMSTLERVLTRDLLVQANPRHYVNLEEVRSIGSELIVLNDGTCIHISRSATTRMLVQISGMLTFL